MIMKRHDISNKKSLASDSSGAVALIFALALIVFVLVIAFAVDLTSQSMKSEKSESLIRQLSQPAANSLARLEVRRLLNDTAPLTGDLLPNLISTEEAVSGPITDYLVRRYEQESGRSLSEKGACIIAYTRRNSNNELILQTRLEEPRPSAISSAAGLPGTVRCGNGGRCATGSISPNCQASAAGWVINPSLDSLDDSNPGGPNPGGPGTPPSRSTWDVNIQFVTDLGAPRNTGVVANMTQILNGFEQLMTDLRSTAVINRIRAGANFYQLEAMVAEDSAATPAASACTPSPSPRTMGWEGCGWAQTASYNGNEGGPGLCVQHRPFPIVASFHAQWTRRCGADEAVWTQRQGAKIGVCYVWEPGRCTCTGGGCTCNPTQAVIRRDTGMQDDGCNQSGGSGDWYCDGSCNAQVGSGGGTTGSCERTRERSWQWRDDQDVFQMEWYHSCPRETALTRDGLYSSPAEHLSFQARYIGPIGGPYITNGPVYPGSVSTGGAGGLAQDTADFAPMTVANTRMFMTYSCDANLQANEYGTPTGGHQDMGGGGLVFSDARPFSPSGLPNPACMSTQLPPGNGNQTFSVSFAPAGCAAGSVQNCDMPIGAYVVDMTVNGLKDPMRAPNPPFYYARGQKPGPRDDQGCNYPGGGCELNRDCGANENRYGQPFRDNYYGGSVVHDPIPAEFLYVASYNMENGPRVGGVVRAPGIFDQFSGETASERVVLQDTAFLRYPAEVPVNSGNAQYNAAGQNMVYWGRPQDNGERVKLGVVTNTSTWQGPGSCTTYACLPLDDQMAASILGIGCPRTRDGERIPNVPLGSLATTKQAMVDAATNVDVFTGIGGASMCYAAALGAEKLAANAGQNVLSILVGLFNCPTEHTDPLLIYGGRPMHFWAPTWNAGELSAFRLAQYNIPAVGGGTSLATGNMACLDQVKSRVDGMGGMTWVYNACPSSSPWAAQMRRFGSDDGSPGTFPTWTGCNPEEDIQRCIFSLWDTIVNDKAVLIDQTGDLTQARE